MLARMWKRWYFVFRRNHSYGVFCMPFEPEEIDDLDESLLETMDREELADFRDDLQETLDQMMTLEPDPDKDKDAYYEWQDRINILNDMIDAIDSRMG